MKAIKISEKVYWVGAIDWKLRNFHGYHTGRGSTYNAFLIMDQKITLIDTVKAPFRDELMQRISSVIDPESIDYIVSNHAEMDHTGSLPEVIKLTKPRKVFASVMGQKALAAHFGDSLEVEAVKTGDTLKLGANSLHFVETKMLHWPDSMFSYLDGEKILFSQDAFGMHLAGMARFAEEYDRGLLHYEAKTYFANILNLYAPKVKELLETLPSLKLDFKMIAPDHGPIWRRKEDIDYIIDLYHTFAARKPTKKAVVVFDTMWDSTEKMALAIADGLLSSGVAVDVCPLHESFRSDLATKLVGAGAIAVGSPTLNNNIYPTVADSLTYITGLKFNNLLGLAFGSYGWSGEAVKQINDYFTRCGIEPVSEGVKVKYVPTVADLAAARQAGYDLGMKLIEKVDALQKNG